MIDYSALAERGETELFWKYSNVVSKGAIGLVIYNNSTNLFNETVMTFGSASIPIVSISRDDGLLLKEMLSKEEIEVMLKVVEVKQKPPIWTIKGNMHIPFLFTKIDVPFEYK